MLVVRQLNFFPPGSCKLESHPGSRGHSAAGNSVFQSLDKMFIKKPVEILRKADVFICDI